MRDQRLVKCELFHSDSSNRRFVERRKTNPAFFHLRQPVFHHVLRQRNQGEERESGEMEERDYMGR